MKILLALSLLATSIIFGYEIPDTPVVPNTETTEPTAEIEKFPENTIHEIIINQITGGFNDRDLNNEYFFYCNAPIISTQFF